MFNLEALGESLMTSSDPSSQPSPSSCFLLPVSCGASAGMHLQLQVLLPLIAAHQTARAVARGAPENRNAGRNTDTQQGCCSGVYSYFKENCCLILYTTTGLEPDICCIPSEKTDANPKCHKYILLLPSLF